MPFYIPLLKQIEDDFESRIKDLETFKVIAGKYDDLQKFLSDFTLEPPSNRHQDKTSPLTEYDEKPLVVSTIHSAKGLEWNTVFIPHALDGLLPSMRSMETLQDLEEERRLFYVACSRAKENLYITMPAYIQSYDAFFNQPSRFLAEIDGDKYETG
jgi:DNA helicase-2/ATP-dependent DNA helicase PcrA